MLAYSLQQKNGLEEGDRGLKGNFLCTPPANVHMMMMMATNDSIVIFLFNWKNV